MEAQALFDSIVIYFVTFYSFQGDSQIVGVDGKTSDLWMTSVTAFTALVFVVNFPQGRYGSFSPFWRRSGGASTCGGVMSFSI